LGRRSRSNGFFLRDLAHGVANGSASSIRQRRGSAPYAAASGLPDPPEAGSSSPTAFGWLFTSVTVGFANCAATRLIVILDRRMFGLRRWTISSQGRRAEVTTSTIFGWLTVGATRFVATKRITTSRC